MEQNQKIEASTKKEEKTDKGKNKIAIITSMLILFLVGVLILFLTLGLPIIRYNREIKDADYSFAKTDVRSNDTTKTLYQNALSSLPLFGKNEKKEEEYINGQLKILENRVQRRAELAKVSVSIRIGDILVADRNVGAVQGGSALNYTNDVDHPDHKNASFKGSYYTWSQAQHVCPDGWRLPTKKEMKVISDAMQFSDGRAYLEDGDGNRCYFPLSGFADDPSCLSGHYWTSTISNHPDERSYLIVSPLKGAAVLPTSRYYTHGNSCPVRCVN